MMTKRKVLLSAVCSTLLLLGCGQKASDSTSASQPASAAPAATASGDTIKVGVLHSLSGTMAISESALKDTVQMLVDGIRAYLATPIT